MQNILYIFCFGLCQANFFYGKTRGLFAFVVLTKIIFLGGA